ncbi:MAG TPA: CheR family methyltransferase [Caldimonas sp.]|nr:CheR family methyltransferase [Caldimonas sp.]
MNDNSAKDPTDSPATTPGGEARIQPPPDHAEEVLADATDDQVPTRTYSTMPMVGLGGSAGSVAALQTFLAAVPEDSGMSYVVVVHLAPDHASLLAEILQRVTHMPVRQVDESARVEADHVYVIAPGKTLASADGHLVCSELSPERGRRVAVDLFFRTLADTHGPHATAIVLSGADADGSVGIRRIKERGGLTIAQDPEEAEHSGMPRSAIATGVVDWILRAGEMPRRIAGYGNLVDRMRLPAEKWPAAGGETEVDSAQAYDLILRYVRVNTGRDFSTYKRATILRRIARRMAVCGVTGMPSYLAFIRTHPGETGALLQDLLISVTNFFRDRESFDALGVHIGGLFTGKKAGDDVRVWVPACASGEEAYSIAMLLSEHARMLDAPPTLQIFATDLDEQAIATAREAVYPAAISADVSEERLRRFFTREARGYRVRTELREMVVFATHDVLKDSPFSRVDLVSCRNLLIYLNREAQERVLNTIHFALRPHGKLFLGVSETVDVAGQLFHAIDKQHRIYESIAARAQRPPMPASDGVLARALAQRRAPSETGRLHAGGATWSLPRLLGEAPPAGLAPRELHLKLIERFAPASVVVDSEYNLVHVSERAGRFLRHGAGEPSLNLMLAVDPALAVDLRTALVRAEGGEDSVEMAPIPYAEDESIVVRVSAAEDIAPQHLLVTFESQADLDAAKARAATTPDDDAQLRRLHQQIDDLKLHLRDSTEQATASAQELKASNEELQAMNEELRSSGEELETSREELQSINEELTTVNQELKGKVEQLTRSNSDLQNLMSGTAIPTVFLDKSLRISLFTPTAVDLFNLIAADVGRPLSDLASRLDYPQLLADAQGVADDWRSIEREVRFGERWLLARLRPYRGSDERIGGVVLAFVDITEQRRIREALRESESLFRSIVTQAAAGVLHTDLDGRITLANARYGQITGHTPESLVGTLQFSVVHPDDRARSIAAFRKMAVDAEPFELEKRYQRSDGTVVWVRAAITAVLDGDSKPSGAVVVVVDVSDRVRIEHALRESEERLRLVVDSAREYAIVSLDLKRRITS